VKTYTNTAGHCGAIARSLASSTSGGLGKRAARCSSAPPRRAAPAGRDRHPLPGRRPFRRLRQLRTPATTPAVRGAVPLSSVTGPSTSNRVEQPGAAQPRSSTSAPHRFFYGTPRIWSHPDGPGHVGGTQRTYHNPGALLRRAGQSRLLRFEIGGDPAGYGPAIALGLFALYLGVTVPKALIATWEQVAVGVSHWARGPAAARRRPWRPLNEAIEGDPPGAPARVRLRADQRRRQDEGDPLYPLRLAPPGLFLGAAFRLPPRCGAPSRAGSRRWSHLSATASRPASSAGRIPRLVRNPGRTGRPRYGRRECRRPR